MRLSQVSAKVEVYNFAIYSGGVLCLYCRRKYNEPYKGIIRFITLRSITIQISIFKCAYLDC